MDTVCDIKCSIQLFREFLRKENSTTFEELSPEDLNSHLKFFLQVQGRNKTNDPILNLTPENITPHSGIE